MRAVREFAFLAAIALPGIGCKDEVSGIPAGLEVFAASLSGANERPTPVSTAATGTAILTVLGGLVTWKVDVGNIDRVNAPHLHSGGPEDAGGVLRNLNALSTDTNFTGTVANGSAPIASRLRNTGGGRDVPEQSRLLRL